MILASIIINAIHSLLLAIFLNEKIGLENLKNNLRFSSETIFYKLIDPDNSRLHYFKYQKITSCQNISCVLQKRKSQTFI